MSSTASDSERCAACDKALEGFLARHVCSGCGMPQPVSASDDFFGALGAPRIFGQNRAELEKRFYEASRALHPDRFGGGSAEAKRRSLERMSFLNDAYRTLRDPGSLREYILKREGVSAGANASMPLELAESWFELQDALTEDPDRARAAMQSFEAELAELRKSAETTIRKIEQDADHEASASGDRHSRELLEKLAREIQTQSYLNSMERDVARLKSRFNPK